MIVSIFQGIAFGIAALAIGMVFKGYILIPSLLIFVSALFLIPKHVWIAFGEVLANGWGYVVPRAQVLGGKAANHAGNVAQQAGNSFRADPWFWSGVISTTLGIAFLLGAAWNQSLGALFVAGVLFLLSAVCFITYYDGWGPIGEGLAKTGAFLKTKAVTTTAKYPLQVWLAFSILFLGLAFYNGWSTGTKFLWVVSTTCALVTIFKLWPTVGKWALEMLKTSVGGNGFNKMVLLDGALLSVYGYYVSQNGNHNLGVLLTTGAIGFAIVAIGLKEFRGYGKK